jgi:hypothetical protein
MKDIKKIEFEFLIKEHENLQQKLILNEEKLNYINQLYREEFHQKVKNGEIPIRDPKRKEEIEKMEEERSKMEKEEDSNKDTEEKTKETEEDLENEFKETEEVDFENYEVDDNLPPEIKKLFYKIVMIVHPDKVKDKSKLEEYKIIFERVVKAKERKDYSTIIIEAGKLGLNVESAIKDDHIMGLKTQIQEIRQRINFFNLIPAWVWYHTDNEVIKKEMLKKLLR